MADIRLTQIISAAWHGQGNKLTYSIYGLSDEGKVYQNTNAGWKPIRMKTADSDSPRPHGRIVDEITDEDVPF